MNRTLAEEYLLLAFDDEKGKPLLDTTKLHAAIAGAVVTDLTLAGALEVAQEDGDVKAGRFRRTGNATPTDPLMAEILDLAHDRKPPDAIGRIGGASAWRNRAGSLQDQLLLRLATEGVLREEKAKVFGLFPTTSWKELDGSVEREVRDRVLHALRSGAAPDAHTAALIALISASDLTHQVFPDEDKKTIRASAKQISEGDWAGEALRKSIEDIQAMMTAIIVTTVIVPAVTS